jgi:Zn ribbon nucleic-acid-binding protein
MCGVIFHPRPIGRSWTRVQVPIRGEASPRGQGPWYEKKTCIKCGNARWETLIMQGNGIKQEREKKRYNAGFVCFQCIMLSYTANER